MDRSELMSRIRSVSSAERSSRPMAVRLAGCALRHQPRGVFGRPDFANKRRKVAVFFHGCFWHGHFHCRMPKTNVAFWEAKIRRNKNRHRAVVRRLRGDGWTVITFWECALRRGKA